MIFLTDTPFVEQFRIKRAKHELIQVAWFENKIYVIQSNMKRVRVFSDRSPFIELPEGIEIKDLGTPFDLVAHSANRSIYISDMTKLCIWKIQMPSKAVIRWDIYRGSPRSLSITPDMELLSVVELRSSIFYEDDDDDDEDVAEAEAEKNDADEEGGETGGDDDDDDDEDDDDYDDDYLTLQLFRLTDDSHIRSLRLPQEINFVSGAAELPKKSFVISYKKNIGEDSTIGVLSTDGENLILTRTLVLESFETIQNKRWNPCYIIVKKNGEMFVTDYNDGRVIWFDSKFTDYRIISSNDQQLIDTSCVAYIEEKQQLLVCGYGAGALAQVALASVFHLSPCSLAKERSEPVSHESMFKLVRKRRTYDFTSKYKRLATVKQQ